MYLLLKCRSGPSLFIHLNIICKLLMWKSNFVDSTSRIILTEILQCCTKLSRCRAVSILIWFRERSSNNWSTNWTLWNCWCLLIRFFCIFKIIPFSSSKSSHVSLLILFLFHGLFKKQLLLHTYIYTPKYNLFNLYPVTLYIFNGGHLALGTTHSSLWIFSIIKT